MQYYLSICVKWQMIRDPACVLSIEAARCTPVPTCHIFEHLLHTWLFMRVWLQLPATGHWGVRVAPGLYAR